MIRSWSDTPEPFEARASDRVEPAEVELREEYADYVERQARQLVALLPREAIRPLYRAARADRSLDTVPDDPLAKLTAYCGRLLPLPPFHVWVDDVRRNPEAHLAELDEAPDAPTALAPATLVSRRLTRGAGRWVARLRGYRDGDTWRGFIAFEDSASGTVHRTTTIFRETDPRDLRRRFLAFEPGTLEAFLRSALP